MENKTGKPHLSFTQINMFLRCPQQYFYRYLENIKIKPTGAMVQGRVWHETLERNYRQKIESKKDLLLDEMQDYFAERLDNTIQDEEIAFEANENPVKLKDQGVAIVEVHHKMIAPAVRPLLVEERFTIDLGAEFPYDLVGIWDLVEENQVIVDNKTFKRTPSQSDIDKNLQFTAYSLGYRVTKKQPEKKLRMDIVVKNKELKTLQLYTTRTNDDCRWFLKLIEKIGQAIKQGTFYPNPTGFMCNEKYCGYYSRCRENR